ncbi:Acetokinase family-domain-containing protein [Abortiporus biennis]|nr:Acetokinase family-domain-containing protein [Abortiporus biennis]
MPHRSNKSVTKHPQETIAFHDDPPAAKSGLILSVNAGSSSLKISLYRLTESFRNAYDPSPTSDPVQLLLTSNVTSISSPPASFSFSVSDSASASLTLAPNTQAKKQPVDSIKDHATAFSHFLDYLKSQANIGREQIVHVCHRVVHGGDYFEPVVINQESYQHIERLSDLAPLHNGAALSVMKACITALPQANSIAYFDTSFHRSIPPAIASYAIDQTIAKKKGLKKYGFHGLSYAFIVREVGRFLQRDQSTLNLIVLHLGSGASVCCIRSGKSLDTSMGLTPLNGLPGATRSGAIDPSLIFHYTNKAARMSHDRSQAVEVHVTMAEDILNKRSGWKSLTGTTEFGEVVNGMKAYDEKVVAGEQPGENTYEAKCKLAYDLFKDRILNYVGSYYLKLQGQVDALVFSGGIGERSVELRHDIIKGMACLGFGIDEEGNKSADDVGGVVVEITGGEEKDESSKRVLVCRTDEQLEMARQTALQKKFWIPDDANKPGVEIKANKELAQEVQVQA